MYQAFLGGKQPFAKSPHRNKFVATAAAFALAVAALTAAVGTPQAQAAGNPGVPQPGSVIYVEDFASAGSGATDATNAAIPIESYTSAAGISYFSDPIWKSLTPASPPNVCDGLIVNLNSPDGCANTGPTVAPDVWARLMTMAQALGRFEGQADPASNQVVMAYTQAAPSVNFAGAVLSTNPASNSITGITGHFYTTSVNYAEMNCSTGHAYLTDLLLDDGSTSLTIPPQIPQADLEASSATSSPIGIDPCATADAAYYLVQGANDSTYTIGAPVGLARLNNPNATNTIADNGINTGRQFAVALKRVSSPALQVTSTTPSATVNLGFSIYNAQATGLGNDAEYDMPQITDVSPSLDKAFVPDVVTPGQVSMLTFTITNTTDLMEKDNWSFTDTLPTGLTVAGAASTTCDSLDTAVDGPAAHGPQLTAVAGSSTVTIMGSLSAGEKSCTVTVPVVSSAKDVTFMNDASNITPGPSAACADVPDGTQGPCGLLPPDPATLNVVAPPSGDPQADIRIVGQPASFDPSEAHLVPSSGGKGTGFDLSKTTVDKSHLPPTVTVTVDPKTGIVTAVGSAPGVYPIPVSFTDKNGFTVTVVDTLTVVAPVRKAGPTQTPSPVKAPAAPANPGSSADTGGTVTNAASLVPMLAIVLLAAGISAAAWRRRAERAE